MSRTHDEWCALCKALALRSEPLTPAEELAHWQAVAAKRAQDEGNDLFTPKDRSEQGMA